MSTNMERVNLVIVGIYLMVMAVIDRRTKQIPVWPGVACMAVIALVSMLGGTDWKHCQPGILVGVFLYAVSRVSRGRVGAGDALVYAVTGMALGFSRNVELLAASLFLASIAALVLVTVRRVGRNYAMPFVPFTAAAFVIVVCL